MVDDVVHSVHWVAVYFAAVHRTNYCNTLLPASVGYCLFHACILFTLFYGDNCFCANDEYY